MRNYDGIFEYRPSLIGTIGVIGATAVGIPIDTQAFKDCLGLLTAGAVQGSTGSTVTLAIKLQESATPTGTGANWTDITNGALHNGSWDFDDLTFGGTTAGGDTTGTWQSYRTGKSYDYLGGQDPNRKRYIRCHATLTGTEGIGPKFSVGFLLGRPNDTLYINNAVTFASTNIELTKLL
jgi:hypothetical protein